MKNRKLAIALVVSAIVLLFEAYLNWTGTALPTFYNSALAAVEYMTGLFTSYAIIKGRPTALP